MGLKTHKPKKKTEKTQAFVYDPRFSSLRSSTTFKLKHRVRVCEMWTSLTPRGMDEVSEATRTAEKSFVIGWPTTNFVATFASQEMKELWLEKLKG